MGFRAAAKGLRGAISLRRAHRRPEQGAAGSAANRRRLGRAEVSEQAVWAVAAARQAAEYRQPRRAQAGEEKEAKGRQEVGKPGGAGADKQDDEEGKPGFWESLIPIWGSGKSAWFHFRRREWGWGLFYTVLAISDVFLVKSLVLAGGRLAFSMGSKLAVKATAQGGGRQLGTADGKVVLEEGAQATEKVLAREGAQAAEKVVAKEAGQVAEKEAATVTESAASHVQPKSCFPAGTPVATSEGLRPIESIRAGDLVWAYDLVASQWRVCPVNEPYHLSYRGTSVFMLVAGEEIESTYRHPYWVMRARTGLSTVAGASGRHPERRHHAGAVGRFLRSAHWG